MNHEVLLFPAGIDENSISEDRRNEKRKTKSITVIKENKNETNKTRNL